MWSRLRTLFIKDVRVASRDALTAYMLVAPLLVALLMAVILPLLENASAVIVVDPTVPEAMKTQLSGFVVVEEHDSRASLDKRVLRHDDVTGVVIDRGRPMVVVQGNEPAKVQAFAGMILDVMAAQDAGEVLPPVDTISMEKKAAPLRLMGLSLVTFSVIAMLAMAVGFIILEEKSEKTLVALLVGPASFAEYVATKLVFALGLSIVVVVPAVAIVLGRVPHLGWLWLGTVASAPFALTLGLLIGAAAKDQLGAIGIMKLGLPVWFSLPIAGFVLPQEWLWTMAPFGNHWSAQFFFALFAGASSSEMWRLLGLTLATGGPTLALVLWWLRRRLGFVPSA